jgi:hypothetical protein
MMGSTRVAIHRFRCDPAVLAYQISMMLLQQFVQICPGFTISCFRPDPQKTLLLRALSPVGGSLPYANSRLIQGVTSRLQAASIRLGKIVVYCLVGGAGIFVLIVVLIRVITGRM